MTRMRVGPAAVSGRVRPPPSKSVTHRVLFGAASLGSRLTLVGPLDADDTLESVRALGALGHRVERRRSTWSVRPLPHPELDARPRTVQGRASGTTLRFAIGLAARGAGPVRFEVGPALAHRPIDPALAPLVRLGVRVRRPRPPGSGRFEVRGPLRAGRVAVSGAESSQPTSGLALALAGLPERSTLRVVGPRVSRSYVTLTAETLRRLGAPVRVSGRSISLGGLPRTPVPARLTIPPDASSAAYLWAAAAIGPGRVVTPGAFDSVQADVTLLDVLEDAGASVDRRERSVRVVGPIRRSFSADLDDAPDLAPLLGVLAATVPGRSRLTGGAHLVGKESDRRAGTVRLARALGARVRDGSGALGIEGTTRRRALRLVDLDDHRLVMAAAIGALAAPGPSEIGTAEAVRKSYPGFWDDLARLGVPLRRLP